MKMELTRRAFLQMMATVLVLPNLPFARAEVRKFSIPVLLYHDISLEMSDDNTITPGLFAAQMEWLYANGYKAISFADLGKAQPPDHAVIITFDDGYASFIPYAFPYLRACGFKATINISGQYIASYMQDRGARPMLSWDEYRYLQGSGLVSLGYRAGHSASALLLPKDLEQFQDTCKKEMGAPAEVIAGPYEYYTERNIAIAQSAGFQYFLIAQEGIYQNTDRTTKIPRLKISGKDRLFTLQSRLGAQ